MKEDLGVQSLARPTPASGSGRPRAAPFAAELLRSSERMLSTSKRTARIATTVVVAGLLLLPFSASLGRDQLLEHSIFVLVLVCFLVELRIRYGQERELRDLARATLSSATESDEGLEKFWKEQEQQDEEMKLFAKQLTLELESRHKESLRRLPEEDSRLGLLKEIDRAQEKYDERVQRLGTDWGPPRDHFLEQLESSLGVTRFGYPLGSHRLSSS